MERVETFANTDPEKMPQRHLGKEEPGPAFLLNGPSVFFLFAFCFLRFRGGRVCAIAQRRESTQKPLLEARNTHLVEQQQEET